VGNDNAEKSDKNLNWTVIHTRKEKEVTTERLCSLSMLFSDF